MTINLTVNNKEYKVWLADGRAVSLEEAIFRSTEAFKPCNLKEHLEFWEEEILEITQTRLTF